MDDDRRVDAVIMPQLPWHIFQQGNLKVTYPNRIEGRHGVNNFLRSVSSNLMTTRQIFFFSNRFFFFEEV